VAKVQAGNGVPRGSREPLCVLCGADPATASALALRLGGRVRLAPVGSGFEAGRLMHERPRALVLDFALGRSECLEIARRVALYPAGRRPAVVALACGDGVDTLGLAAAGFAAVLFAPADPAALAKCVLQLCRRQA
jgi:DNA-binding response OmpR family regulator